MKHMDYLQNMRLDTMNVPKLTTHSMYGSPGMWPTRMSHVEEVGREKEDMDKP